MRIGVLGAMPEETDLIVSHLTNVVLHSEGMRTYYSGSISGIELVVVFSRWGKVAAAATVTTLIQKFSVDKIIFTGVAGAIAPEVKVGDIVIAKRLVQHDMDPRPLMKRFEIPLLNKIFFEIPQQDVGLAELAVMKFLEKGNFDRLFEPKLLKDFNIQNPSVHVGDIASGDQFIAEKSQKEFLLRELPGVLCVEMEGAAIAQVCYEYTIPFVVIRIISDASDESSPNNFSHFINTISRKYSFEILLELLKQVNNRQIRKH